MRAHRTVLSGKTSSGGNIFAQRAQSHSLEHGSVTSWALPWCLQLLIKSTLDFGGSRGAGCLFASLINHFQSPHSQSWRERWRSYLYWSTSISAINDGFYSLEDNVILKKVFILVPDEKLEIKQTELQNFNFILFKIYI